MQYFHMVFNSVGFSNYHKPVDKSYGVNIKKTCSGRTLCGAIWFKFFFSKNKQNKSFY